MKNLKAYFQIARVNQYVKNSFVWLPLFFGYKLKDPLAIWNTFWAFLAFCSASSCVYVLNDIKDIEDDRAHPVKSTRPLASGVLPRTNAIAFMVVLFALTCVISVTLLPNRLIFVIGSYIILNIAYSFFLKHFAIIDVVCIATGFVLRIFAGGISADVQVTHWIIIMTFLLALFLALAKRRDDLVLSAEGHNTRRSIGSYTIEFVSLSMILMGSVIIVSYLLYTVSPEIVKRHGTDKLYLTGFWVILGLLRYMQITIVKQQSGSPTKVVLTDRFLQLTIAFWILSFYLLIYAR